MHYSESESPYAPVCYALRRGIGMSRSTHNSKLTLAERPTPSRSLTNPSPGNPYVLQFFLKTYALALWSAALLFKHRISPAPS